MVQHIYDAQVHGQAARATCWHALAMSGGLAIHALHPYTDTVYCVSSNGLQGGPQGECICCYRLEAKISLSRVEAWDLREIAFAAKDCRPRDPSPELKPGTSGKLQLLLQVGGQGVPLAC